MTKPKPTDVPATFTHEAGLAHDQILCQLVQPDTLRYP